MSKLRERLKERDPKLSMALENSWEIAQNEWLPAIKINMGSYNSYPHLRNLEKYLDQIVIDCEKVATEDTPTINLRAVEIYVICSAILFHDIGRIKESEGHGTISKKFLIKNYAKLGIPSERLAEIISDICEYHEPNESSAKRDKLVTTSVNPYGRIRVRKLASLLKLIDQMDSAFTRVVPKYLNSLEEIGIVGVFRSLIKDVYIDPKRQMICSVLGDLKDTNTERVCYQYNLTDECVDDGWNFLTNRCVDDEWKSLREKWDMETDVILIDILRNEEVDEKDVNILRKTLSDDKVESELRNILKNKWNRGIGDPLWSIFKHTLRKKLKSNKKNAELVSSLIVSSKDILRDRLRKRKIKIISNNYPKIEFKNVDPKSKEYLDFMLDPFERYKKRTGKKISDKKKGRLKKICDDFIEEVIEEVIEEYKEYLESFNEKWKADKSCCLLDYFEDNRTNDAEKVELNFAEWLVADQKVLASCEKGKGWNKQMILMTIMADLKDNIDVLQKNQDNLEKLGVHVKGWCLEYDEHLFNKSGRETFEPIFSKEYLEEVAKQMWKMSTQIFGTARFSYKSLASAVRERDVEKIKIAVERLSKFSENIKEVNNLKGDPKREIGIWAGDIEWQWQMSRDEKKHCNYLSIEALKNIIQNLIGTLNKEKSINE